MKTNRSGMRTLAALAAVLAAGLAFSAGIRDNKHNLSITGPGPVKSTTEEEICIFCHTPHNARRDIPYLWNRADSTANYTPYQSSTLNATVGQPTGASKLCLSCHDGTVALGALVTRPQEVPFPGGLRYMPEGRTRLGTDLADDHPVSFPYDAALAATNGELASPSALPPHVKLDRNREMQCTACHDPHEDTYGDFLVMPNQYSGLCTTCHQKQGWTLSSHATSIKGWSGQGANPWPESAYTTVAENACASCHKPHSAGRPQQLLNHALPQNNCLVCHTGTVAAKDIGGELMKTYGHFVQNYPSGHDAGERFGSGGVPKHVQCVDCHNPHESRAAASPGAPFVPGATAGVSGIDASGQEVGRAQYGYEICYKCHADNNVGSSLAISRQLPQLNTRLEFDSLNPSFHSVAGTGVNMNLPSLIAPLTVNSRIACTDCHGNSNPSGPKGPHGSSNPALLAKANLTADNTTESPVAYELCYSCHSRSSILGDQSFKDHRKHIVNERTPCSACHDPHGVSYTQGNPVNNAALINFDLSIVQPDSQGRLYFEKTGIYKGQCYLNCHGKKHEPEKY